MSGKRVLWRDRCEERVRERRRRQGRVWAALTQADAAFVPVAETPFESEASFDLASWLMMGPAGEAMRPREAPFLEP